MRCLANQFYFHEAKDLTYIIEHGQVWFQNNIGWSHVINWIRCPLQLKFIARDVDKLGIYKVSQNLVLLCTVTTHTIASAYNDWIVIRAHEELIESIEQAHNLKQRKQTGKSPELVYRQNAKSLRKVIVVAKEEALCSAITVHHNQSRRVLSLKSNCIDEARLVADRSKPTHFRTGSTCPDVHLLLDVGNSAPADIVRVHSFRKVLFSHAWLTTHAWSIFWGHVM